MEFDQNTQKDTNTEAEQKANQYSNLIAELRGIGEYLMIAVPSSIDNQEMKRLEAKLSSLRNILNNELRKGRKDETGEISVKYPIYIPMISRHASQSGILNCILAGRQTL